MPKFDFHFETKYGPFGGAITVEEGDPITDEEVEAEKHRRLNDWLELVEKMSNQEA